jgi:hypothetical protein
VGLIDQEAEHILGVVHQMSVALKVDARALDLHPAGNELAAVVQLALTDAETRGHSVTVDDPLRVEAGVDIRWLAEAVRQGIDNAARFSPEGSAIRISVMGTDGGPAQIEIVDCRPGRARRTARSGVRAVHAMASPRIRGRPGERARLVHLPGHRPRARGRGDARGCPPRGYHPAHPAAPEANGEHDEPHRLLVDL